MNIVEELKKKYLYKKKLQLIPFETTGKDSKFYISGKSLLKKTSSYKGHYCVIADNYTRVCSPVIHEIIIHSILNSIKHPNIIELEDILYYNDNFYLKIPKIEKPTKEYPKELLEREILLQTTLIIGHLQDLFQFTHNDLKLDNIMIQETNKPQKITYKINGKKITYTPKIPVVIKLIDFGHSMINNYKGIKIFRYFNTEFIHNKFKEYEDTLPNIPKGQEELFSRMYYFYRFQNFLPHMDLEKLIKRTKVFPENLKKLNREDYIPLNLYKILNK